MSNTTPNIGLSKPTQGDVFNPLQTTNADNDILDAEIKALKDATANIETDAAGVTFESALPTPTEDTDPTPLTSTFVGAALDELTERNQETQNHTSEVDAELVKTNESLGTANAALWGSPTQQGILNGPYGKGLLSETLRKGVPGDYIQGTHFDIPDGSGGFTQPFQTWLDQNINNHYFNGNVSITFNNQTQAPNGVSFMNVLTNANENSSYTLEIKCFTAGSFSYATITNCNSMVFSSNNPTPLNGMINHLDIYNSDVVFANEFRLGSSLNVKEKSVVKVSGATFVADSVISVDRGTFIHEGSVLDTSIIYNRHGTVIFGNSTNYTPRSGMEFDADTLTGIVIDNRDGHPSETYSRDGGGTAAEISFDPSTTTLTADNVQGAIEQVMQGFQIVPLPDPQNLTLTDGLLTWDSVDGAIGYRIYVNYTQVAEYVTGTQFDLTQYLEGLDEGVYNRIRVVAFCFSPFFTESYAIITHIINPPLESVSLEADSWETIGLFAERFSSGQLDPHNILENPYNVGDRKTVLIGGETQIVEIMGFVHDDKSNGAGKAGITFGMVNLLATNQNMNASSTNAGGWYGSRMRTQQMPIYLSQMPSDLQAVIKEVNKMTANGGSQGGTTVVPTPDRVWLFSQAELSLTTTDVRAGEGTRYAFWATRDNNASRIKTQVGQGNWWYWLRSPRVGHSTGFRTVDANGSLTWSDATGAGGVCLGFCV